MSDRYVHIYKSDTTLYVENSPVLISALALVKDNSTSAVMAQLKFKNVGTKKIDSIKVTIQPFDNAGRKIDNMVSYTYMDLGAKTNADFGSREAIILENKETRSFTITVNEVIFEDKTMWQSEKTFELLPEKKSLKNILTSEQIEQYRIEVGTNAMYVPEKIMNLWYCTCGNINSLTNCSICGNTLQELINVMDRDTLQRKYDEHKQEETIKNIESSIESSKHLNKIKRVFICTTVSLGILIAGLMLTFMLIIPNHKYKMAEKLELNGEYQSAVALYDELGSFKDSINKRASILYNEAKRLYNAGNEEYAMRIYSSIIEYSDAGKIFYNYLQNNTLYFYQHTNDIQEHDLWVKIRNGVIYGEEDPYIIGHPEFTKKDYTNPSVYVACKLEFDGQKIYFKYENHIIKLEFDEDGFVAKDLNHSNGAQLWFWQGYFSKTDL